MSKSDLFATMILIGMFLVFIEWLMSVIWLIVGFFILVFIFIVIFNRKEYVWSKIINWQWEHNLSGTMKKASIRRKFNYINRLQDDLKDEKVLSGLSDLIQLKEQNKLNDEEVFKLNRYLDSAILMYRVKEFNNYQTKEYFVADLKVFRLNLSYYNGVNDVNELTADILKELEGN